MARLSILVLVAFSLACGATMQRRVEKPQNPGFLAGTYDKLTPGGKGEVALRYVKEDVDWSRYHGFVLDPVQYWDDPGKDDLDPDVEQMLTSYLHASLRERLTEQGFTLEALPGPGVARVQLALLDASAATPILRSVSLVVPAGLILNTAQRLVTDRYTFSGQLEVAMKVTDSQTGEVLAAALDRRSGGASPQSVVVWQWGDAKAAIDVWSERFAERVSQLAGRLEKK